MCKLIKSLLLSWRFGLLYYSSMFGCCSLLNDDLRNAAFADPDFSHSFVLRSNNVSDSFREILTGRNQMPFHIRVHSKVLSGVNAGFFFEAVGAIQVSAEPENHPFGGLVFAYDRRRVRIWAPSLFEETGSNGQIIVVGKDWGGQSYSQTYEKALVVVHIWYTGPSPTFQANTIVNTADPKHVFVKINHNLEQIPERVMVRVTPYSTSDSIPNHGFWFNGITASQNSKKEGYGGVIFAYDTKSILLWVPSSNTKRTGCIFVGNKWGRGRYAENTQKCMVHIFAWVLKFPVPSFKTEWYAMISQGRNPYETFLEVNHNLNKLPLLVVVQGQIGTNGLIFEGTGTVMSSENNTGGYGGILFAYDENYVRVWLPKRYKEDTRGYGILVKEGWGDGHMLQAVHKVSIRVILYSSICDQKMHMITDNGECKAMPYNSFQWVIGPWSKCSSICDKGVNHREILGCSVSTRETVLECDFARDMCGWHSLPIKSWSRVKNTIVNASDNFG
ncbi:uncharacterized protein LOC124436103 [Xenia sp. Carnegie-2017]|uniref:uncharacterized protein LOC124436103 n=1 Tax=Xenia sp. Carnegie-2017 TaxID=2897299 RepID=UPI001F0334A6|nr:uncharacterized protein LOC124436103 [Xenia sp. Carnegie-2017]